MHFPHSSPLSKRRELPSVVAIYGVYKEETLLYVGSASSLKRRFQQHASVKKFDLDCVVKWKEFPPDDAEAFYRAELEAIASLKPPMNVNLNQGAMKRPPKWTSSQGAVREKSNLHQAVYDLLWERIRKSISKTSYLDSVAKATGLNYHWLDLFSRDCGGSPSVDRIELLYKHLTGHELHV